MVDRVFIDLDGPTVDFDRYMREHNLTSDEVKARPGAYLEMEPVDGALKAISSIIGMGFEVWIATKPPTGIPFAYADKAAWVLKHLPDLKRRIIITHDKGMLGDKGDFLIDDRPHRANCFRFLGQLLPFGHKWVSGSDATWDWPRIVDHLSLQSPNKRRGAWMIEPKVGMHIKVTAAGIEGAVTAGDYTNGDKGVIVGIDLHPSGEEVYHVEWVTNLLGVEEHNRLAMLVRGEFEVML